MSTIHCFEILRENCPLSRTEERSVECRTTFCEIYLISYFVLENLQHKTHDKQIWRFSTKIDIYSSRVT